MSTPWYDLPVTQAYGQNGEMGVDVGTPLHTPITALYDGKVVQSQYGGAGGIVGILVNVPGLGQVVSYYLHLDRIDVQVGDTVAVGQQVGLSGGELAGTPGGLHPASPQFSTGPHTEFGFFHGTPFASADAGDPLSYLHPDTSGGTPVSSPSGGTGSATSTDYPIYNIPLLGGIIRLLSAPGIAVGSAIDSSPPVQSVTAPLANALEMSIERIGWFILALVMLLFGFILIVYTPVKQVATDAVGGAMSEAGIDTKSRTKRAKAAGRGLVKYGKRAAGIAEVA